MATSATSLPAAMRSLPVDGQSFGANGLAGPIPLLTAGQCEAIARYLDQTRRISPSVWIKGRAADDGLVARIGAAPPLVRLLRPLLGDDIILWGASSVRARRGIAHPWHVDIESARREGGFVSVWIGLRGVGASSGMRFIAGSHCSPPIQQFQHERGEKRGTASDDTVLGWARESNPEARIVELAAGVGEAVLFDGRTWHASINDGDAPERLALLLQFAAADVPVRIPDMAHLRWPFAYLDRPRPPVIAVHGRARPDVNAVEDLPPQAPARPLPPLASDVRSLDHLPLAAPERKWQAFPLFRGRTRALDFLSCHAAVLRPGFAPHAPHAHQDEELLVVLDGEADILVADCPEFEGARRVAMKAGDFAYYPAFQHHTIRNASDRPVHYLMFRWNRAEAEAPSGRLKNFVVRDLPPAEPQDGRGFVVKPVFEGRTQWLRKLHCHSSRLEVGAGYADHADAYDVAILVQSGRVRTLGREAGPGELIFYPAGEIHGMRNAGDVAAQYLVFEFHGAPVPARPGKAGPRATAALTAA